MLFIHRKKGDEPEERLTLDIVLNSGTGLITAVFGMLDRELN